MMHQMSVRKIVCLLLCGFIYTGIYAQKTIEDVRRTVETVDKSVSIFKKIFPKKERKKTDTVVKAVEKQVPAVKEADILKSPILNKAVIARLVFDQKEASEYLWKARSFDKIDEDLQRYLDSDDDMFHTEIAQIFSLNEGNIPSYTVLLLTYSYVKNEVSKKLEKQETRFTGAGIGFANIIRNENGNWQLIGLRKIVAMHGSSSTLPEYKIIELGDRLRVFSIVSGYSQGGQFSTNECFYALNPEFLGDKVFDLEIEASFDGGMNPKNAYRVTRAYRILPVEANEEYPRVLVTETENKKVKPAMTYAFSKEKERYIISSTSSKIVGNAKSKNNTPAKTPVKKIVPAKTVGTTKTTGTATGGTKSTNSVPAKASTASTSGGAKSAPQKASAKAKTASTSGM